MYRLRYNQILKQIFKFKLNVLVKILIINKYRFKLEIRIKIQVRYKLGNNLVILDKEIIINKLGIFI